MMRLIQYVTETSERAVGLVVDSDTIRQLEQVHSMYQLAMRAIANGSGLAEEVGKLLSDTCTSYSDILEQGRLLAPVDHQDSAHLLVTGTGLTHLGSADTRDAMHSADRETAGATDTIKMFRMGLAGGKPQPGETGVQPEWFYKGDGDSVVAPGAAISSPGFALDAGEEPEIVGIYINDSQGQPHRIGFALGNELSDHKIEQQNYLYLAHSKLRACSFGPELLVGELPADIQGVSRILRNGEVLWEKSFLSGEQNMSHSIANLEYHHFKYPAFCRPGDVHVHFFGTATLSFGDGVEAQAGDVFEIASETFGRPLRNTLTVSERTAPLVKPL